MFARRNDWIKTVLQKRIIVHTKGADSQTIDGSLVATMSDGIILRAAKMINPGGNSVTTMAGEVFIPRENVAFCQLDE